MNERYQKQLADRKDELAKQYKTAELQATVERLRERTERATVLRRLTGGAARDRAELEAGERQLADVRQRTAEQLGAVTTAWDRAACDLSARHARQAELAREVVAERRPTHPAAEQVSEAARDDRGGGRGGRDRDAGGRERVQYRNLPTPSAGV